MFYSTRPASCFGSWVGPKTGVGEYVLVSFSVHISDEVYFLSRTSRLAVHASERRAMPADEPWVGKPNQRTYLRAGTVMICGESTRQTNYSLGEDAE
jgi:hypothetical protein